MADDEIEILFSPIKIHDIQIKNRIVLSPMSMNGIANFDGTPKDWYISFLESVAKGGVGMIITGETAVSDEHRMRGLGLYSPKMIPSYARLVEASKAYEAQVFLQIAHPGGVARSGITGRQPIAPTSMKHPRYTDVPRELSKDEIQGIIEQYVQTADWAMQAGFDGVELHAAHGFDLIGQFISPSTNKRKDEYGGSFEGRMKFTKEILKGIKDICGSGFPVGLKYNGYEAVEDGIDLTLAKKIGQYTTNVGVNYLHIASMTHELNGYKYPSVSPLYTESGALIELAQGVKEEVQSIPVMGVGGINKPEHAEDILKNKKVDMLALGRALIADPDWAEKARRKKIDNIRPCIRCNVCHQRLFSQQFSKCTVNPFFTWHGEQETIRTTRDPKKVAIIGGGPAGIQAALVASQRGHEVILYEKNKEIGGNLIPGTVPTFKSDLKLLLHYYRNKISNSDIQVKLGMHATADTILDENPDSIILAVGSKHIIPEVPGIDNENVITATEVLDPKNKREIGKSVIVLGAGLVGCETAWYLSQKNRSVHLVDVIGVDEILTDEHHANRVTLLKNLGNEGVRVHGNKTLEKIEGNEFYLTTKEAENEVINADNLIIATGFTPKKELKSALSSFLPEHKIYEIGDCVRPGRLFDAIHGGKYIAEKI